MSAEEVCDLAALLPLSLSFRFALLSSKHSKVKVNQSRWTVNTYFDTNNRVVSSTHHRLLISVTSFALPHTRHLTMIEVQIPPGVRVMLYLSPVVASRTTGQAPCSSIKASSSALSASVDSYL